MVTAADEVGSMNTPSASQTTSRSSRYWVTFAVFVCLPILAVSLFAAIARTDDIDGYLFAYYAKRMLAGQVLYADLWDNKPPGIFWANLVGLFAGGGSYSGVVAMLCAAAVGAVAVVSLAADRLYGRRTACVAAVLASVYLFQHHYHVGSNRASTFFVPLDLLVFGFYVWGYSGGRWRGRWMFAAGVCAVGAICFRQTAFAAAGAVVVHQIVLWVSGRQRREEVLRAIGFLLAGSLAAVLVVIGVLGWTSDLGAAWEAVVVSNTGYFQQTGKSQLWPEVFRWQEHLDNLGLPLLLGVAVVIHAVVSWRGDDRPMSTSQPPGLVAFLMIWLVFALYLAAIGPNRRLLYFAAALCPLVMLATHGVWLLLASEESSARRARFGVIVAVLWFGFMMTPAVAFQVRSAQAAYVHRFASPSPSRFYSIVSAIEKHTEADDAIYIWGYRPEVYWLANRPLAQRYIVSTLVEQRGAGAQPRIDEVIAELKARPPKAIVISEGELRFIDGEVTKYPVTCGDFGQWLREHYATAEDPTEKSVWIRRR
jgi:hypothetical protein